MKNPVLFTCTGREMKEARGCYLHRASDEKTR
jgi:hypothetical protein